MVRKRQCGIWGSCIYQQSLWLWRRETQHLRLVMAVRKKSSIIRSQQRVVSLLKDHCFRGRRHVMINFGHFISSPLIIFTCYGRSLLLEHTRSVPLVLCLRIWSKRGTKHATTFWTHHPLQTHYPKIHKRERERERTQKSTARTRQ